MESQEQLQISDEIQISSARIIDWMNVLREERPETQHRLLENFWASQIKSKAWLVNAVKHFFPDLSGRVYILGGWYGLMAQLIVDNFNVNRVYSVDNDPRCLEYGRALSNGDSKIMFLNRGMETFDSYVNPKLIINTSTEHITREAYDTWMGVIPTNTPIVLQGNSLFECTEHIRCHKTLEEFSNNNPLGEIIYSGSLNCGHFDRFMIIGYKK